MSKTSSGFSTILQHKCPRCRKGKMFVYPVSYRFSRITKMHDHCPSCNLKFEREPGFFYGAMYISYALTVALWVAIAVAMAVLSLFDPWTYLVAGIVILLISIPFMYRLSRSIWLSIFVKYDPNNTN
jgi:uncharacterized protein (DUF983 family)